MRLVSLDGRVTVDLARRRTSVGRAECEKAFHIKMPYVSSKQASLTVEDRTNPDDAPSFSLESMGANATGVRAAAGAPWEWIQKDATRAGLRRGAQLALDRMLSASCVFEIAGPSRELPAPAAPPALVWARRQHADADWQRYDSPTQVALERAFILGAATVQVDRDFEIDLSSMRQRRSHSEEEGVSREVARLEPSQVTESLEPSPGASGPSRSAGWSSAPPKLAAVAAVTAAVAAAAQRTNATARTVGAAQTAAEKAPLVRAMLNEGRMSAPLLLIMVGAQGAGKSTFCDALVSASRAAGTAAWRVVCQDTCGKNGTRGGRETAERMASSALAAGRAVVIDRMHLDEQQRRHFLKLARNVPAHAVVLQIDGAVCAERVRNRKGHYVYGEQGARMAMQSAKKLMRDLPGYDEGFELISIAKSEAESARLVSSYSRLHDGTSEAASRKRPRDDE